MSINAEKAAFFVTKLQVKTLPTLVFFKDGVKVDAMVGFADIGNTDEFPTSRLLLRIQKALFGGDDDDM
eukprot:NODE_1753_length_897_cov_222.771226_g1225_i0.p4 GENE.NODE_1753_length_897_cov_222.771226_g1225_i0~~NODE_1753_length_897_cov_222.771226_g1225_i0.p4  ORF type:complete len:69 (+),score=23.72 NODE_1753_length_897_cov_222.771226_g1225_i0:546-752(+)